MHEYYLLYNLLMGFMGEYSLNEVNVTGGGNKIDSKVIAV
jgi:hypothetical protein